MIVDLTEGERAALCMELEHSPDCVWSEPVSLVIVAEEGEAYPKGVWLDQECTIPYVEPPCTCGYFKTFESAKAKLRGVS